jgi:ATP-binding cassette subfamily B protein
MRIFRELGWFFRQEKRSYAIGVLTLFLVALLELFPPYVIGVIVDAIESDTLNSDMIGVWMMLLALSGVLIYILRYVWRVMLFGASMRLGKLLRERLYRHFTCMPPSFFHRRRTGDLMAHATNDVSAVEQTAGEGVLTLVDSLTLGSLVVCTMAFTIHWKLTVIALLPLPVMAWAVSHYGRLLHERFHRAQEAFSTMNDKVQENISGVRVIKAMGLEEKETEAFRMLTRDVAEKNIAVARVDALFEPTISAIVGFSFFLTVAVGAYYVVQGEITVGELTQFSIYLGRLIWPMLAFGWLINILERGSASYDRIRSLLEVKPEITDEQATLDRVSCTEMEVHIDSFTYPEQTSPALQQIHLHVRPGQTVGVVGKTGSGKSTLLRLLLREWDVADGVIRLGGHPLSAYRLDALRGSIGYVPQDHFLFSTTVAENIAFGKPEATREEIETAARLASIHEDILRFDRGYETMVGERGVTLSGGQKQRISIARAQLLDPPVLILDDALSAVDAETEQNILHALRRHRNDRTTWIAAHRMSAVEHADLILVLDGGKIAESGTHDKLMARNGWYAMMYRRQQLESMVEKGVKENGRSSSVSISSTSS